MAVGGSGMAVVHTGGPGGLGHHRPMAQRMSEMMDGHRMHGSQGGGGRLRSEPTIPGAEEVELTAAEFSFQPSLVEVAEGTEFNLTLANRGTLVHDLVVRGISLHLAAEPGRSVSVGVSGLPAGEYEFLCSVPGHAEAGMTGVLEVSGT